MDKEYAVDTETSGSNELLAIELDRFDLLDGRPAARSPETAPFRHVGLGLRRNPQTGGQTVIHTVEVHGPQPDCDRFLAQYRNEALPSNAGQKDKVTRIDNSAGWRPGQRLVISQELRLPAAIYSVAVAFFDARNKRRLPLPGMADGLLPVGPVAFTADPLDILQSPRELLPADPACLLDQVLAMPALRDADARDNLTACYGQAPQFGHVLEFGVASGRTINHLASLAPHRTVWGFDTFEGLPEPWVRSKQRVVRPGTFSSGGKFPYVRENVRLVPGLIQHTLPEWLEQNPGNVSLIHIDVDLYSSARAVLELLNDRIVPSSVIVFDDVAIWRALQHGSTGGYDNWQEGEWKALLEWSATHSRRFALMSRLERSVLAIRVLT